MLALVAGGWVVLAIAIAATPERVRTVGAKEGAVELLSHIVLASAVVAWVAAAVVARRRAGSAATPAWPSALVALAAAIVLGEELDWGGVLGLRGAADWLESRMGAANVHNAARGHSYLLFALAAPVLAWVALGRSRTAQRWRSRFGPWAPRRDDGLAALLVIGAAFASALVLPAWESEVDEVAELFGYAIVAVVAARGHVARASGLASST